MIWLFLAFGLFMIGFAGLQAMFSDLKRRMEEIEKTVYESYGIAMNGWENCIESCNRLIALTQSVIELNEKLIQDREEG